MFTLPLFDKDWLLCTHNFWLWLQDYLHISPTGFNLTIYILDTFIGLIPYNVYLPQMNEQQMALLEQLRREASMKRLPASQTIADMKSYIAEHSHEDFLLVGFAVPKGNPYREKSSCDIL